MIQADKGLASYRYVTQHGAVYIGARSWGDALSEARRSTDEDGRLEILFRGAYAPVTYETDGACHNAEPGTYGHECGRPAQWIGTSARGFRSGYCSACKATGFEARNVTQWEAI